MSARPWTKERKRRSDRQRAESRIEAIVRASRRRRPTLDRLEDRTLLSVTSAFVDGVLSVSSDADDAIVIDSFEGNVRVNGADPDTGAVAAADVIELLVFGGPGGNDIDAQAVTPSTYPNLEASSFDGAEGNDRIVGTEFADLINGGPDGDTLFGLGGEDIIEGGLGSDEITGGKGNDSLFAESALAGSGLGGIGPSDLGDLNTFIWNNGDGSDLVEGGLGSDTQVVNGSASGDEFLVGPNFEDPSRVVFERLNLGQFTLDLGGIEIIDANGRLGDDELFVDPIEDTFDLLAVNFFGDEGDDTLILEDGASLLFGNFDGGAGSDTIDYSNFTEAVEVNLGGGDTFFEANLSGLQEVPPNSSPAEGFGEFILNADETELAFNIFYEGLQGPILGGPGAHFHEAPPGQNGPIVRGLTLEELNGSTSPDGFFLGTWTDTDPVGFPTPTSGPLTPALVEALKDGNIYFNLHTTEFPGGEIRGQLELTGTVGTGPGVFELLFVENVIGTAQADTIIGNDQDNLLIGGPGNDLLEGLRGDDEFLWNNGDGSDVVDGGWGFDEQVVNGAPAGDEFVVRPGVEGRLIFERTNLGPFALDIGGVEALGVESLGGPDEFLVEDLTGVGDIEVVGFHGGFDNDVVDARAQASPDVLLELEGGNGNDEIFGSPNADEILGGQGNDVIIGGPGDDTIFAGIQEPGEAVFAALRADDTALIFFADSTGEVLEVPLTGLEEGENAIGVDFRPSEEADLLYVLTDQGRVYTTPPTGELTLLSTLAGLPEGTAFGVDFNPVADQLRIVSDTNQNLQADVETGITIVDGNLAFAPDDPNAGADPNIVGAAYTNSFNGATSATLFDIDSNLDVLTIQSPQDDGTLETVGGLGVDTTEDVGFDILAGSETVAFATLTVDGVVGLYEIDLATGEASLLGTIGDGTYEIISLAVGMDNDTVVWNNGDNSDFVEGGLGQDVQIVNGSANDDEFDTFPNGPRFGFSRVNFGQFTLDIGTTETLEVNALEGDDSYFVGDLEGVQDLELIQFDGGLGDDEFNASGILPLQPPQIGGESTGGGGGIGAFDNDEPLVDLLPPILLEAFGGEGDDTLIGSPNIDLLDGGPGNDFTIPNNVGDVVRNTKTTPGDFDGDGITDIATYTFFDEVGAGQFAIERSTDGETILVTFGGPDDFPVAGDYDGDGVTDIAVFGFSPENGFSRFAIMSSANGSTRTVPFGGPFDFPVAGDYDGDGITDIAVFGFSPDEGFSRFAIILSGNDEPLSVPFGGPFDFPVAGDYNGDGITDIAVFGFSPDNGFSRFAIILSGSDEPVTQPFGGEQDSPVPGDYDGDRVTDIAVFGFSPDEDTNRFAVILSASDDPFVFDIGEEGDQPVAGSFESPFQTNFAVFGSQRFLIAPLNLDPPETIPFGATTSIPLPPPSDLFPIQPLPPANGSASLLAADEPAGDAFAVSTAETAPDPLRVRLLRRFQALDAQIDQLLDQIEDEVAEDRLARLKLRRDNLLDRILDVLNG